MPAPEIINQLVQKFTENRDSYRSGKYNEARLRQEFLDPFFEALGWDIYNRAGVAPDYADVVIEDSLEIEGAAKAPDYAFKIGRERKFFVEAKKPKVDIQYDIHPAYQLRRYAWNAKLPLSILTDFEELAVYNCKNKPNPSDSAATGRDKFYKYTEFVEKWDEIAAIFSRDSVWKGSFDRFAASSKGKKGTTEVDDAILADIEDWRKLLALNIALRNPQVADERQLNYAVQMTIDRILFLRICEDRGIEPDEQLKALTAEANIYPRLVELFRRADKKYNSGLFHFEKEKGDTAPADTFTPSLKLDDKVLKEIIHKLYYPCPYIFKEIPVEILGQVYEQFLGKVIHLTAGHQARIEEKPEVRKAGGVYYTPQYIVDYIVANTVGKLLEGKTPEQSAQLKIVDPACGSGSFLLGAFQYLLDWHEDWYINHDPEHWAKIKSPSLVASSGGSWKLTTRKKKEILVNNIHGVDIDPQAVEVTKLSLLLKVLEEESGQLSLGFERVLPDLGRNIQCGNSLIGEDYFSGQLLPDEKERQRVNPFEWHTAFPEVFIRGGFDAVIGNPPYIRIQLMNEWAPNEVVFYKKKYVAANKGNYDIYVIFVEKGLNLLSQRGILGFILPHKFFNANYGEPLRKIIVDGKKIRKVINFGDQQVFLNATTYTCLLFLSNQAVETPDYQYIKNLDDWKVAKGIERKGFDSEQNSISQSSEESRIQSKLDSNPYKLSDVTTRIFQGVKTSADKIFIVERIATKDNNFLIYSKEKNQEFWLEQDLLHPLIKGGDSKRYKINKSKRFLLFPYQLSENGKIALISEMVLKDKYPLTWDYLIKNKLYLENRENGKMKGSKWYSYIYPKNFDVICLPKIFTPDIAPHSSFSLDEIGDVYFTGGAAGGYGILVSPDYSRNFILGLLNSKLLEWYLQRNSTTFRGGWYSYESRFIHNLPIRTIDFSNPADVKRHEQMVALVQRMLGLHKRVPATPQEFDQLARDIASTDRAIDALVYELYGLTPEEIKIVEGN